MKTTTTHCAKTHLSRLLKEVQRGEEIVILNGQTPAGRLVAVVPRSGRRPAVGTITSEPVHCATDAFAPLDDAVLQAWGAFPREPASLLHNAHRYPDETSPEPPASW